MMRPRVRGVRGLAVSWGGAREETRAGKGAVGREGIPANSMHARARVTGATSQRNRWHPAPLSLPSHSHKNKTSKPPPTRPAPPAASPSPASSTAADPASLFARLGGADAVYAVTSELFDRLLADPHLGHFFEADTLPKHKKIVAAFIGSAVGGAVPYKGRNMVDAHIGE
jgi:hypothetical protein